MVQLEDNRHSISITFNTHFNSTMVQLEAPTKCGRRVLKQFQFHNGSIRRCDQYKGTINKLNFNSTMVQLEV